ncbi:hypothetical protein JOD54_005791 [Actinokineospora baliensis]|uniref:hypothetical protein n=1 Tax=Actinokineospora baliensis TaxID=547056 RepID=UPI00195699D3|nr:hypothetical protein [Actinokineospora baliensis]MBM7775587.1 hypothetical protein [Actinokineospora baliensis]
MLADVARETGGLFDRRFLVNALLPTLATLGGLGAVVVGSLSNPGQVLLTWNKLDGTVRVLVGTGIVVVAVLLAAVVAGRAHSLIRAYEGIWSGRLGRATARWTARWRRRETPTRLGDILRDAEVHPAERYGLDAVVTWPRLYPLLPDKLIASLVAARAELEFQLTISALACTFAVASGAYLTAVHSGPAAVLACYWGGLLLAWGSYRSSLAPARLYAGQVKVAFDLYRQALLTHLALPVDDERAQWQRLGQFWHRNIPMTVELVSREEEPVAVGGFRFPFGWFAFAVVVVSGLIAALV